MTDNKTELRKQAEEKAAHFPEDIDALSPAEIRQTLHELRVHQIELEIQNEELHRIQGKLEASRARYFDLYDMAPVGYCTLSEKGLILEANFTVATLLSITRQKLAKQPFSRFVMKDDQDIFYLHSKQILEAHSSGSGQAGEPQECELRMLKEDGAAFWAHLAMTAAQDATGETVCRIVLTDITERKRAEGTLRESEELFRSYLEYAPDGIYMNDLEGNFLYGNRKCEEILGYRREELIGKNFLELNILPENSLNKAAQLLQANMDGKSTGPDEIELIIQEGRIISVEINTNVVQRMGQKIVLSFVRDITKRKQAEEEKRNLEERLQRAEKMEALGLLAGGVAHDLNNVLGIVVGYAELVLMNADQSSSIRPQLVNIMNGGLKAAAIVDDLLTLARRGVSGREVLNLNKIIADCHHSPEFANLSSHHPYVKINTELDPELLNISCSSIHLGKSLFNLVSNASEAMPKGGTVTIRTANQYLDKPIQGYDQIREGDYVVLSVSDTGEGINTTDLQRIFEPFYTKKVMGRSGTGLGLAVVWGTVKDHHGYINVESEEGKGSTFTLYFPVTREYITPDAVATAISEYMGSGESILVVDDVKEQRDLASGMLRTLNYNVASVESGEEAIAYLREHQADLIILDMIMDPGMDGLDTYKNILEIRPQQKAIIVSGFSESDRVKAARGLGAGAYVRKPYVIEKLGLAVRKELDRSA